jgi:hypothetical protein
MLSVRSRGGDVGARSSGANASEPEYGFECCLPIGCPQDVEFSVRHLHELEEGEHLLNNFEYSLISESPSSADLFQ